MVPVSPGQAVQNHKRLRLQRGNMTWTIHIWMKTALKDLDQVGRDHTDHLSEVCNTINTLITVGKAKDHHQ